MKRFVTRVLPSGETKTVYPFHVCIKGAETAVHCRDDEDYDVYVKYIALCARRKNVLVIIYAVVSNHCHVAVLAARQTDADAFAQELKKMYSQWFRAKYHESKILHRVDAQAILLDNDWYLPIFPAMRWIMDAPFRIIPGAVSGPCSGVVPGRKGKGFRPLPKGRPEALCIPGIV